MYEEIRSIVSDFATSFPRPSGLVEKENDAAAKLGASTEISGTANGTQSVTVYGTNGLNEAANPCVVIPRSSKTA